MGKQDSRIHDLLSPVIETVRSNKINSFFQLKNKLQDQAPHPSFIFQPYAATPANPQAKMYMTMYNSHRSPRNNPEMSPRTAGSPTRASNYQSIILLIQEKSLSPPQLTLTSRKNFSASTQRSRSNWWRKSTSTKSRKCSIKKEIALHNMNITSRSRPTKTKNSRTSPLKNNKGAFLEIKITS